MQLSSLEQRRRDAEQLQAALLRMREWFEIHLAATEPVRGQRPDTILGDYVGLKTLAKRSGSMRYYGRCTEISKERAGTRIRCAINCRELSPGRLRKAFARVHNAQLRQMHNPNLRQAGSVLGAEVQPDGVVDLTAIISDPTAALKVGERAYTGCVVSFDGDEISDVSLVDAPTQFLEKGGNVIAKIYDRGASSVKHDPDWATARKMSRANGLPRELNFAALKAVRPATVAALPDRVEKALQERERCEALLMARPHDDAAKAAFRRADEQTRIAVIGSARPSAVGDAGLIRFLRHGRA